MKLLLIFASLMLLMSPATLFAGKADVIKVGVDKIDSTYRFSVTVKHSDEGWQHYADKWDIVSLDGQVIATRVLHHPHVNEQPFTRSLSGVVIDNNISSVTVRAHDLAHGYGGKEMTVSLP